MPKKVTPDQRQAVLHMLAQGQDRDTIAAAVGVTPGQVSAILAHVKMGTYTLPALTEEDKEGIQDNAPVVLERETNLLRQLQKLEGAPGIVGRRMPFSGAPFLTDGQILILRRWIAIGAPRN